MYRQDGLVLAQLSERVHKLQRNVQQLSGSRRGIAMGCELQHEHGIRPIQVRRRRGREFGRLSRRRTPIRGHERSLELLAVAREQCTPVQGRELLRRDAEPKAS